MALTRHSIEQRMKDRAAQSAANRAVLCASRGREGVTYAGGVSGPQPKTEPYRDPALLEMARDRPCLLLVPGTCSHRLDTVVAAHSNQGIHGKAGARKADDCYSAWACSACHGWLDAGGSPSALKERVFMDGHLLQVLAWRQIADDASEPERFRKAARRALERLGATPIGDMG